jgi:histidinol-phosphate aminotransferase
MDKRLVKVAPYVLDLTEPQVDNQEGLFTLDENTLLKLDQNEATVAPSPRVIKALQHAIDSKSLNHQTDIMSRKLRRKISDYAAIGFDYIDCFAGQAAVMETITRTYLYQGLDALLAWSGDNSFTHYAHCASARVINAQFENPFEPKIEELINGITPKTRMIYISNPNSITGAIFTEAELVFLLSYATDSMIVIDESYFELCGFSAAHLIEKYSNLMVIRTFSKAFALAGLDVYYLLTDPSNLRFTRRLSYMKQPNLPAQVAAVAAMDSLDYIVALVTKINESKKMLFDNLSRLGYEFRISPANFFLLAVSDSRKLADDLMRYNIFIKRLDNYHGFENYVRITIGTPAQTGVLLDVLGRFAETQAISLKQSQQRIKQFPRTEMKNTGNRNLVIETQD